MHQETTFDWSSYDFTGHLHDKVDFIDIADKASIRTKMFKTFLAHYERQDICEEHEHDPESDAIKSLLQSRLTSNKEWLPQNLLDDINLIKNADEKTTNLLFQLLLIVEHEATVRRLAEDFTRHNPMLFGFTFKAIEKFYSDVAPVSLELKEEDDVSTEGIDGFSNPSSPIATDETEMDQEAATRKRVGPQKKCSKGRDADSEAVSVRKRSPRVKKPRDDLPRRRETPVRKCAKILELASQSSNESSSAESDDDVPTTYVKKDVLKNFLVKKKPPRIKCSFEGCSKMVCNSSRYINEHLLTHTGEKPFMCDQCGRRFKTTYLLQGHMVTHDDKSGSSWVKCTFEGCDKMLVNQGTRIRRHMLIHSGKKSHMCSVCGKCYQMLNELNVHMRLHTGENLYECEHCDKKFVTSKALKEHTNTHTGERPWKCKECGKAFGLSGSLSNHIRLVHRGGKNQRKPKQLGQGSSSEMVNNHPYQQPSYQ